MKRSAALLVAVMLLLGSAAWAEIEFGGGLTPIPGDSGGTSSQTSGGDILQNAFTTAHLGWRTVGIFYLSGDFVIVPPSITEGMTSYYDSVQNAYVKGISRPAVISIYDVGLKIPIGSISIAAQIGINQFYVYRQSEIDNFNPPSIGANLKVGVGLKMLKFMGLEVSAISVQPDFKGAVDLVTNLFSSDSRVQNNAVDKLLKQIVPLIQLVIYL